MNPLALRKYLFDILPPIQHAHDLKDIVHDSVENDMRARGKRPESWAQFISRPPYKRMIFDGGNHLTDFAKNFFCRVPAGDALVFCLDNRRQRNADCHKLIRCWWRIGTSRGAVTIGPDYRQRNAAEGAGQSCNTRPTVQRRLAALALLQSN
jgi:hypothetical protein